MRIKLSKQISLFIKEHYDFLLSFDLVKIYNPQKTHELITSNLDEMLNGIHGRARRYIENTKDVINRI